MTVRRWYLATSRGYATRARTITRDVRDAWPHFEERTARLVAEDWIDFGLFARGELEVIHLGAPLPKPFVAERAP